MKEVKVTDKLKDEYKSRKKVLEQVNSNISSYSSKIKEYESRIKQYEIMEIKYKTLEKEHDDSVKIFDNRVETLEQDKKDLENELFNLKKKDLTNDKNTTALKTIVQLLIKKYGLKEIIDLTDFTPEQIEKYMKS